MRVWIDPNLCTGVALCEGTCPEVFAMADDGVAHVRSTDGHIQAGRTAVAFGDQLLESVLQAAEDCPEECIFLET